MAKISTSPMTQATTTHRRSVWASKQRQEQIIRIAALVIATIGVLINRMPVGGMMPTRLKTRVESITIPPTVFPQVPQWNNYYLALVTAAPFGRYFYNTMSYALSVMFAELPSCSFIA